MRKSMKTWKQKAAAAMTLVLSLTALPAGAVSNARAAESTVPESVTPKLEDGTYAEGEAIVFYREGALAEPQPEPGALRKARRKARVSDSFGEAAMATSEETRMAATVSSQEAILKKSLGDGFTIEDSLNFDENKTGAGTLRKKSVRSASADESYYVSLVSSDRYTTEELIEKLSANKSVEFAEPNYTIQAESADYSLNDTLLSHATHLNDNSAVNRTSADIKKTVNPHGADPLVSMNASDAWAEWDNAPASVKKNPNPPVVAVIDTGVDYTHEELRNRMWTNPGNAGLAGTYGYDFENNDADPMDDNSHGTWCASCIAAEADNGSGISGVVGKADVRIMALKILDSKGSQGNMFAILEAFNYIERAVDSGVNVKITSNSYGGYATSSREYDRVIDSLGAKGVLTFVASGNDAKDLEPELVSPACDYSDYRVTVNAASENGDPVPFTNFGRTRSDLFAPGMNLPGAVSSPTYHPALYSKEKLEDTTEYYGEFSANTSVSGNSVTPECGDDGKGTSFNGAVKRFGASKTILPKDNPQASASLSIDDSFYINHSDNPASLKWSIRNARQGDIFYLYFPYQKNLYTGDTNTYFSTVFTYRTGDQTSGNNASGNIVWGDAIILKNGEVQLKPAESRSIISIARGIARHSVSNNASYDEITSPRVADYGLCAKVTASTSGDMEILIDSIAISKPGVNKNTFEKYDLFSGTSMATPAAAGAAALLSVLSPEADALALKNRLYSTLTYDERYEDLCSTGGRIDFSNLKDADHLPAITAIKVNRAKGEITILGNRLGSNPGKLTYTDLYRKDAVPISIESSRLNWTNEKITITGASDLIGKYLRFVMETAEGRRAQSAVYTSRLTEDAAKACGFTSSSGSIIPAQGSFALLSDGTNVYASDGQGTVYQVNKKTGFTNVSATNLIYSVLMELSEKSRIEDSYRYQVDIVYPHSIIPPTLVGKKIYYWVSLEMADFTYDYLGVLDLNTKAANRSWNLTEITAKNRSRLLPDALAKGSISTAVYQNKIFALGATENGKQTGDVFVFNPSTLSWSIQPADQNAPEYTSGIRLVTVGGSLYGLYGKNAANAEVSYDLYRFNGKWTRFKNVLPQLIQPKNGRPISAAVAACKEGIIVSGLSTNGYGDTFLIRTSDRSVRALNTSLYPGLNDNDGYVGTTTSDTFYVLPITPLEIHGAEISWLDLAKLGVGSAYETVRTSASGGGKLTGAGVYQNGSKISIKAVPNAGCYLKSATLNGKNITAALKKGAYTFTANGNKDTVKAVFAKYVTSVKFTKKISNLKAGKSAKVRAVANGTETGVTYKSSNTSYATVSSTGVVKALKAGAGKNVTITATSRGTNAKGRRVSAKIQIKIL